MLHVASSSQTEWRRFSSAFMAFTSLQKQKAPKQCLQLRHNLGFFRKSAPIHFSLSQKSAVFTVQNCPHCGQMCLPRCAHDTLAFSCFFAAAFKIPRFFPFRHFLRLLKATFHFAALALCQRFSNAPARRRNVRFSGVWRVRARPGCESRTNRRHGRDGAGRAGGHSCISCICSDSDIFGCGSVVIACH